MYTDATTTSKGLELSFYFIFWSSVVLLAGVTIAMIVLVVKYRRSRNPVPTNIENNTWLELTWTVAPTILVMFMFYYGWAGFLPTRQVPEDAMVVKVTGRMWSWLFEYENGKMDTDLYVPVDKPVKLILTSPDVNHSFYVAAFSIKEDCIPGRENYMWFQATRVNKAGYDIQCAEYCGSGHYSMLAKLFVLPQKEFDDWYRTITPSSEISGQRLALLKGCLSCHSLDGSSGTGPSFKGLYGRKEIVRTRGQELSVTVDEEYLIESMLNPDAKVVKGFSAGKMPSQEGLLSEEEQQKIVEFLKELE